MLFGKFVVIIASTEEAVEVGGWGFGGNVKTMEETKS